MDVDLDKLRSFVAFAEALNFTHAAAALGISQPALHVKIKRLSDELGRVLYLRRGRQLLLTPDGVALLGHARELLDRHARLLSEVRGDPARPVTICAGEGSWLYWLGAVLVDPPHPVDVLVRNGHATLDAVRSGAAHVGVLSLDRPPDDLESVPLRAVPMVVALPAGHPLAAHPTLDLLDLAGVPLVAPPSGGPLRGRLESEVPDLLVAAEAVGWPITLRFVALGVGVAVVNGFCTLPDGVVARPLPEVPARTYFAVRRAAGSLGERRVWEALRALT